jgi:L-galactose dehydrogenase
MYVADLYLRSMPTACKQAAELCQQQGADLARIALQSSIAFDVDSTLVGVRSIDELESNIDAVINRHELQTKNAALVEQLNAIFAPHQGTTWSSGLPCNN